MSQALAEKPLLLRQSLRFAVAGIMNTGVDFVTLNILILAFELAPGDSRFAYFKALSYVAASCNSFVLNKWWVFKNKVEKDANQTRREMLTFVGTSLIGLCVNAGISLIVFHTLTSIISQGDPSLFANVGALSGTLVVLLFNFFTYKFIIFK